MCCQIGAAGTSHREHAVIPGGLAILSPRRPTSQPHLKKVNGFLSNPFSALAGQFLMRAPARLRRMMANNGGAKMIHDTLHELFQAHYIHEVLHLLSGCVGSFFGTWAYFRIFRKRRIEETA
jgi:hypothetical protein